LDLDHDTAFGYFLPVGVGMDHAFGYAKSTFIFLFFFPRLEFREGSFFILFKYDFEMVNCTIPGPTKKLN